MFQASDGGPREPEHARRDWMGVLARASLEALEGWFRRSSDAGALPGRVWLRRPETGLVMLRGRIGGGGERFNVGEMTVTRCALRIESGEAGIAYVGGRSHRKAEIAALADAMLQSPTWQDAVRARLIEPLRAQHAAARERVQRKAQATRVEFFTVARQAGA